MTLQYCTGLIHDTEYCCAILPPFKLSTIGPRAFPVAGPLVWNSLPADLTSAPSLSIFHQRQKTSHRLIICTLLVTCGDIHLGHLKEYKLKLKKLKLKLHWMDTRYIILLYNIALDGHKVQNTVVQYCTGWTHGTEYRCICIRKEHICNCEDVRQGYYHKIFNEDVMQGYYHEIFNKDVMQGQ